MNVYDASVNLDEFMESEEPLEVTCHNRYEVLADPNTKQLWVYDNEEDAYIAPPAEVLDAVMSELKSYDNWDEACNVLMNIIADEDPDWLRDEDYWYEDIEP